MKSELIRKMNNYTAKTGRIGTLMIVKVGDKETTLWSNDPNFKPLTRQIEVQEQLDEKGKGTGQYSMNDANTVEDELKMKMNVMKSVFEDAKGLFQL